MGTRNLTAVVLNGEYRVAQYGQWDGYPSGQGATALHFLEQLGPVGSESWGVFREKVAASRFASDEEIEAAWQEAGAPPGARYVSMRVLDRLSEVRPELSRDAGAEVLRLVYERPAGIALKNSLDFAGDGLFCEWAYVIDLDKGTFEVYVGFGTKSLNEEDRFFFLQKEGEKHAPVKMLRSYSLDDLPSLEEFLKLEGCGDEEE